MNIRLLALCLALGLGLGLAPAGPARAQDGAPGAAAEAEAPPSAEDLALLRRIGFNEAQILAELAPFEGRLAYDAEALATLEAAGFGADFLEKLAALAPRPRLDNASIAAALDAQVPLGALIDRIAAAETDFDTSAPAMLALGRARDVPAAVTKAMMGTPLTGDDLRLLAEDATPAPVQLHLIEMLGSTMTLDDPAAALDLARAGVPADVLAALREGATPVVADTAGDARAADDTAPGAGEVTLERFTHVTDIFAYARPRAWYATRRVALEGPVYQASADQPDRGADGRITTAGPGLVLRYWPRDEITSSDAPKPADLLDDTLSRAFAEELGEIEPHGEATSRTLDGHDAAMRDYASSVSGTELHLRWHLAVTEQHVVGVLYHAPSAGFDAAAPLFDRLAETLEFPRSRRLRAVPDTGFASSEVARRHAEAVVYVAAGDEYGDWQGFGTGFFTRSDGYLVTNHHVIWNRDQRRPWRHFRIFWSNELDKEPLDAQLIAGVSEKSELGGSLNVGIDLALLKVSGIGDFDTIPLSPLARTRVGDTLITMGFPIGQVFDSRVSTTISSGVVTRFNRDGERRIDTIITDAKIAPGNSGGPAISLTTGGVIGLNTISASQSRARLEDRAEREAIGYGGIMPIDRAIENFPQETIVRAARDRRLTATDAYDLALFAEQRGWRAGAISLAEKAVQRAPNVPETHELLARVLLAEHPDRTRTEVQRGERELDLALSIDPGHQAALYTQADHAIDREEYLDAIKAINTAIEARDTWTGRLKRARIFDLMGQPDDALGDLDRAIALSGEATAEPYLLAGQIRYAREEYEKGLARYRKALEIAPQSVEARLGIGRYYLHTDKLLAALLEFDEIADDEPRSPEARAAVATAYARQGNPEKAVENFQRALLLYAESERKVPEETIALAAETAADKLLDPQEGRFLYGLYAGLYYDSRGTLVAHRYLADQETENDAVRRAHLARAIELKGNQQDDERDALEERLDPVRNAEIDLAALRRMRERDYPNVLIARIIAENPDALTLAGTTNADGAHDEARIAALRTLAREFGGQVTVAILRKVRGREIEAAGARQGDDPLIGGRGEDGDGDGDGEGRIDLVGTWVYERGGTRQELRLIRGNRYRATQTVNGNQRAPTEGTWRLDRAGEGVTLVLQREGRQERRFPMRAIRRGEREFLVLTHQGNEFEYARQV